MIRNLLLPRSHIPHDKSKPICLHLISIAFLSFILILAASAASAQTYTVLHSFTGPEGELPASPLLPDGNGGMYGSTENGGVNNCGTIFKVSTATGGVRLLYSFQGGSDGCEPSELARDRFGNLYGTTYDGGAFNAGTVFKLDRAGNETVLYSFTGGADGLNPWGPIALDALGNLYGTTFDGGKNDQCSPLGCGVVFQVDPAGNETVLYTFLGGEDGYFPEGVVRDEAGTLYGTSLGGIYNLGTLYQVDSGGVKTVLHSFSGQEDGAYIGSGLSRDRAGNFYGATSGTCRPCGTVFRMDPAGILTTLHTFGGGTDGIQPNGELTLDAAGNIYGTTSLGGESGAGTVFMIDTNGNETVLHQFAGRGPGSFPDKRITQDTDGNLYGVTIDGGAYNYGLIYKLALH